MGQVVSFYSFKGGTGRSTSLSNVAYELAKQGKSVGCMDFDLSAPGLHWIFDVGANRLANTKRIHDRLDPDRPNSNEFDDYVLDLTRSYRDDNLDGDLFLMPGDINAQVAAEITGNGGSDGGNLWDEITALISDFEAHYDLDYIFLDSRSGISNQAVPIFRIADVLLTFTKWTHQHKLGTEELISWILETGVGFENIVCVASNVPNSVQEVDVADWIDHALHHDVSNYELIFESDLLKEKERIVTREKPDSQVARQYRELASSVLEQ